MNDTIASRLRTGAEKVGVKLDETGLARLCQYFHELRKWAPRVNLIGKKMDAEQIIDDHFVDSLSLLPFVVSDHDRECLGDSRNSHHLLDIGSGAGFPGLVCKVACPELRLTLVEPRKKRVDFLNHVVRLLGLDEVWVLECRIEDEDMVPSEGRFTHITSRGVAELEKLLQMADRFGAGGAELIWMKGPRWQRELEVAQTFLAKSTYRLERKYFSTLPSGAERTLLRFVPRRTSVDQRNICHEQ